MYGEGISKIGGILDSGVSAGVVNKSGSWFSYNDQKLGQGRENSKAFLSENPEIAQEIDEKVRAFYNLSSDGEMNDNIDDKLRIHKSNYKSNLLK